MSVVIRERTTRALSQAWRRSRIFLAALAAFGVSAVGSPASASEPTSLETVMHGMHDKMAIQQTGDFDVDFAR